MSIDDTRTYTLTKYCTTKGVKTKTQRDHNILFAKFGLKYNTLMKKTRYEIFHFKNLESQKKFLDITNTTEKLSTCFESNESLLDQADNFMKRLNGTFQRFQRLE